MPVCAYIVKSKNHNPHFGIIAGTAYSNAQYGAGSGPIYLTEVSCTGTETSLLQCNSDPILSSGCSHAEDAGVKCEGSNKVCYFRVVCNLLYTLITQLHVLTDS